MKSVGRWISDLLTEIEWRLFHGVGRAMWR